MFGRRTVQKDWVDRRHGERGAHSVFVGRSFKPFVGGVALSELTIAICFKEEGEREGGVMMVEKDENGTACDQRPPVTCDACDGYGGRPFGDKASIRDDCLLSAQDRPLSEQDRCYLPWDCPFSWSPQAS